MVERDPIPISALQHYVYCPRQAALIHLDGEWLDNVETARGRREHDRVDDPGTEMRAGIRCERFWPASSGARPRPTCHSCRDEERRSWPTTS